MKGKEGRLCRKGSKLDPIPVDLKKATVTRLPRHQKTILHQVESRKRKERDVGNEDDEKKDTSKFKFECEFEFDFEFESLPLDLKMAIVSRLDAKSLMKFRCVSKIWSSIIRSRGFIDSFFSMSSSTQSRFIVALSNGIYTQGKDSLTFLFSFSHSHSHEACLVPNLEMAIPVGLSSMTEYFTSLHGFLAVNTKPGVMLCNPSTEQVIKLPMSTRFVGYDPIDDQHKALVVDSEYQADPNGNLQHKVLTLGPGGGGLRHIEGTPGPYRPISVGVCINGFIYYGARNSTGFRNPVMVCFDVRSEKLSFIQAPHPVVAMKKYSVFIDYNGKLASIVRNPFNRFSTFDLWILQDPEKHEWSKQTCDFPHSSVWDYVASNTKLSFPGTNKAGEIIIAPMVLPHEVQPFYIFYYNVQTNNIRRVRLLGIGDNLEFRRSYGFFKTTECYVRLVPQHVDSIASL